LEYEIDFDTEIIRHFDLVVLHSQDLVYNWTK